MKKLSLSKKLKLSFFVMAVIVAVVCLLALYSIGRINHKFNSVLNEAVAITQYSKNIQMIVNRIESHFKDLDLAHHQKHVSIAGQNIEKDFNNFGKELDSFQHLVNQSKNKQDVIQDNLNQLDQNYMKIKDNGLKLTRIFGQKVSIDQQMNLISNEVFELFQKMSAVIMILVESIDSQVNTGADDLNESTQNVFKVVQNFIEYIFPINNMCLTLLYHLKEMNLLMIRVIIENDEEQKGYLFEEYHSIVNKLGESMGELGNAFKEKKNKNNMIRIHKNFEEETSYVKKSGDLDLDILVDFENIIAVIHSFARKIIKNNAKIMKTDQKEIIETSKHIKQSMENVGSLYFPMIVNSLELKNEIKTMNIITFEIIRVKTNKDLENLIKKTSQLHKRNQQKLKKLKSQMSGKNSRHIQKLFSYYNELKLTIDQLIEFKSKNLEIIEQKNKIRLNYDQLMQYILNSLKLIRKQADEQRKDMTKTSNNTIRMSIISNVLAMGIAVVLCVFLGWFVSKMIISPVNSASDSLKDIAEGEGDLTQRLNIKSEDEIGLLAKWFNIFVGKLQSMIQMISKMTKELNLSSKKVFEISHVMTDSCAIIKTHSTKCLESSDELSQNINKLKSGLSDTNSNIQQVASNSQQISTSVKNLDQIGSDLSNRIINVKKSIKEMATGIDQMSISIDDTSSSLNEISKNCSQASQISSNAKDKVSFASSKINDLGISAKDIEAILEIIKNVAEQTNLLALNATIEAAGAGNAGKGFAVVANEVKELAKQTAIATEDIRHKIENIQMNTANTSKSIGEIKDVIDELNKINTSIASSVEESSSTVTGINKNFSMFVNKSKKISNDMNENSDSVTQVSHQIEQTSKSLKEISKMVDHISISSEEGQNQVQVAVKSSENISNSLNDLDQVALKMSSKSKEAQNNSKSIDSLAEKFKKIVGQFKV